MIDGGRGDATGWEIIYTQRSTMLPSKDVSANHEPRGDGAEGVGVGKISEDARGIVACHAHDSGSGHGIEAVFCGIGA